MNYLRLHYTKEEATKIFRSINGIVSALNSRQKISSMTKDEYYYNIKSKFRNREQNIRLLADTKEFQQYINKRYYELI